MKKYPDPMGSHHRKSRRRKYLKVVIILLVILGSITAGFLLIHGLTSQRREVTPAANLSQHDEPETTPIIIPKDPVEPAPTTGETTAPTEETASTLPPEVDPVQAIMDTMSLREKICQLFIVCPEAISNSGPITLAPSSLADDLTEYPVGGIILFAQNLVDAQQCSAMLGEYQSLSRIPMLIGVDEEGGTVSRLGSNEAMGVTAFPHMADIGARGDTAQAYHVGYTLGTELSALGFNLDFAPVADVNSNKNNPVIGNRAFSSDPHVASEMVFACVSGFEESGIACVLKHFPGHGDTKTDSHKGEVSLNKTLEQLRQTEFLPFQSGIEAGAPMVMVAHISLPKITGDRIPATLNSAIVTDILRTELGFSSVVITDAMNMGAITQQYSSGEAALMAIAAGCDMILMPEDMQQAIAAIEEAIENGTLSTARLDESVRRILTLKLEYGVLDQQFQ